MSDCGTDGFERLCSYLHDIRNANREKQSNLSSNPIYINRDTKKSTKKKKNIKYKVYIDEIETYDVPAVSKTRKKLNADSNPNRRLTGACKPVDSMAYKKKHEVSTESIRSTSQVSQTQNKFNVLGKGIIHDYRVYRNSLLSIAAATVQMAVQRGIYSPAEAQEMINKAYERDMMNNQRDVDRDDHVINEEVSVTIYWNLKNYVKFSLRKVENVLATQILLMYNCRELSPEDTPYSIDYNAQYFIEGRLFCCNTNCLLEHNFPTWEPPFKPRRRITLKFLVENQKSPYEIKFRRNQRLSVGLLKFAEKIKKPLNKLECYLNGKILNPSMIPLETEMKNGQFIDVKIIK